MSEVRSYPTQSGAISEIVIIGSGSTAKFAVADTTGMIIISSLSSSAEICHYQVSEQYWYE